MGKSEENKLDRSFNKNQGKQNTLKQNLKEKQKLDGTHYERKRKINNYSRGQW